MIQHAPRVLRAIWRSIRAGRSVPWLKMLLAVLGPKAPPEVRAERLVKCKECPLYSGDDDKLCLSNHPRFQGVGCGCYIPAKVYVPEPYKGGCFGWSATGGEIGWPKWERPPKH